MGYRNILPRHPSDDYATAPELCAAFVQRLAQLIPPPGVVIEPSAGNGPFVRACREQWPQAHIVAIEVREECEQNCMAAGANEFRFADWMDPELPLPNADLDIGNPPYFQAEDHIKKALERLQDGKFLCFLLRMAFLNSQKRTRTFWEANPRPGLRYLMPLAKRPSFTGNRLVEHSEYAFFCFQKGFAGNAEVLPHLWF